MRFLHRLGSVSIMARNDEVVRAIAADPYLKERKSVSVKPPRGWTGMRQ